MLSKKVKERRRFNRVLRSEPCWRVAMRSYKMQQLTIVRLHVMYLQKPLPIIEHTLTTPEEKVAREAKIQALRDDIANLKRQQKEMTREEWYKELDQLNGHHSGMREWVLLLLTNED